MTQIVLGRKDKIDFRTTLEEVAFLNTVNEMKAGQNRVFLEATEENIAAIDPQTHDLYVPSHQLTESQDASQNIHVYFDLEKDRKSTRLNSSHVSISYDVFCLKKKTVDLE